MKYLLFILILTSTVAHAQIEPIFRNNHFFNSNLISNGNHTHNAQQRTTTITGLGSWSMRSGIVANTTFAMDSTGASIISPSITLSKGVGVNPRIWLDGANDVIYLTTSTGKVRIENLPTYADDTAAGAGGLAANTLYKTSTGVLMIKL